MSDEVQHNAKSELPAIARETDAFERAEKEESERKAAKDRERAEALKRRNQLHDLFEKAQKLALEAEQQSFAETALRPLAEAITAVARESRDGGGAVRLDSLPASSEPHPELIPLRFAIELLKTGRDAGSEAVFQLLTELPQHPLWQGYYRWLGPLAVRLCGTELLFNQSAAPCPYPLPVRCKEHLWDAADRMLGRSPTVTSTGNVWQAIIDHCDGLFGGIALISAGDLPYQPGASEDELWERAWAASQGSDSPPPEKPQLNDDKDTARRKIAALRKWAQDRLAQETASGLQAKTTDQNTTPPPPAAENYDAADGTSQAPPATEQGEGTGGSGPPTAARHSPDFRSVNWFGTMYTFTPTQAACVKVLWQAWENKTPEVGQETILEHPEVEAESKRLVDLFKRHPAWGTMIVTGNTAGAFRLNPPDNQS